MQSQQAMAFLAFGIAAAVTPGPSNVLVMATAAQAGWALGLRCLCGVVVGMALLMGVASLGLASALQAWPGWLLAARVVGSVVLLRMAWQVARAPAMAMGAEAPATAGFVAAFLLQWVNPKSWVVAASAAAAFGPSAGEVPWVHALQLGAVFALAAAPSCAVWLAGGSLMRRWLVDARRAAHFQRAMGLLLAASVALLWT